ncbi:MAG TPA: hypothetical protein VKU80_17175 [Planctomycetota bacterium]|nr:hypothetical protein [Planctomycetota bacterium]
MTVPAYKWRNEILNARLRYQEAQAQTRRESQERRRADDTVCTDCGDTLDTEDPEYCSRCKAEIAAELAESLREEEE